MHDSNLPLKVIVAGGSLGGLCAGVALRGIGCEVEIYERAPGPMTSRGAGIVVQEALLSLLRQHRAPELPATSCVQRQYLHAEGGEGVVVPLAQKFTSWSAIYRTLRSIFPDDRYHLGSTLTKFLQADGGVTVHIAGQDEVQADLLVCADGSASETRRRLLPEVEPRYAGYVAWRGTLDEDRAPPEVVRYFDHSFTACEARSAGHILCYFIPADGAAIEPGRRQLNWVWYVPVPAGSELKHLLTDKTGKTHAASVPAGMIPSTLITELYAVAARELHPRFVELVQASPEPFIQAIFDVEVPRTVFGRACLLGDAAFVLRPHAAVGTAKAVTDATTLAAALAIRPTDPDGALRVWETRQLERGQKLVTEAVALGKRTVGKRGGAANLCGTVERLGEIAQPQQIE